MLSPATLWAFSRPHTMLGTSVAAPMIGAHVGGSALGVLPAALASNLYVTGLNQIADVPVDRINKPGLPIPSGDLSPRDARRVVVASLILSTILSMRSTSLFVTCAASNLLGTLYSLEPVRLKRRPLFAAASIVSARGVIVNVGFASHAVGSMCVPRGVVLFFSIFAVAIAMAKDVPDMRGDWEAGLPSYAIRFGRDRVVKACTCLLCASLLCASRFIRSGVSFLPLLLSFLLLLRTRDCVLNGGTDAAAELYKFYWLCFYACYLALPLF